jgi:DMATS type aromatic prenyltransferase
MIAPHRHVENSEAMLESNLGHLVCAKLDRLCEGLGCGHFRDRAVSILNDMSVGWRALPARTAPYWPSDITDDGTPVEFSVAMSDAGTELRLLVEAQQFPVSLQSNWRAGLALNQRLAEKYAADLSRFDQICAIFAPAPNDRGRFALWHSAAMDSHQTMFKVYVNPQITGAVRAPSLVKAALNELGMQHAWSFLSEYVLGLGEFVYFSLDLSARADARVKVYAVYPATDLEPLARSLGKSRLARPEQVVDWVTALTGARPALDERGIQVCYSFRAGHAQPSMTLYVPVRSHCSDDAEALQRANRFLSPRSGDMLSQAIRSFAGRPLETGRGLITYVALRAGAMGPRVTVYLSPEIYAIGSTRPAPGDDDVAPAVSLIRELNPEVRASPQSFATVLTLIDAQRQILAQHDFLTRLRSPGGTLDEVRLISGRVAFFVMCFQDLLRLVHSTTTDPFLKALSKTHELEDAGHDDWYLQDLRQLGVGMSMRELFSREARAVRDVVYTQISDVLRARTDCARVAVVFALEAAGAEFFESMIGFVEEQGSAAGLSYFARRHQRVEQSHDVFEEHAQQQLSALPLDGDAFQEVLEVVQRTFGTMRSLADHLLLELNNRTVGAA